ncbi:hypothetical protein [Pontibacter brevis]
MKSFDTKSLSTIGLLVILSLFVLLHLSILIGVIPYEMVWGGRLKHHTQMLYFEGMSIAVNLLMLVTVGVCIWRYPEDCREPESIKSSFMGHVCGLPFKHAGEHAVCKRI